MDENGFKCHKQRRDHAFIHIRYRRCGYSASPLLGLHQKRNLRPGHRFGQNGIGRQLGLVLVLSLAGYLRSQGTYPQQEAARAVLPRATPGGAFFFPS